MIGILKVHNMNHKALEHRNRHFWPLLVSFFIVNLSNLAFSDKVFRSLATFSYFSSELSTKSHLGAKPHNEPFDYASLLKALERAI